MKELNLEDLGKVKYYREVKTEGETFILRKRIDKVSGDEYYHIVPKKKGMRQYAISKEVYDLIKFELES